MHRRMSLGLGLLFVLMFLAGSASALPEPPIEVEASAVGSFDLLDWVWEWITSLVQEPADSSAPGGEHLNNFDGGGFMDPNGGNS